MNKIKHGLLIVLFALTLGSCTKDDLSISDCDNLQMGLMAEDVEMVSNALKDELSNYSRENLVKLAATVAEKCNVTASAACFNCIYTDPMQSEIRFSFNQSGTSIDKSVDISYNAQNHMRILRVHN